MILPLVHQRLGDPSDEITGFHVSTLKTTTHEFTLLAIEHAKDTSWPTHDWDLEGVLLVEGPEGLEGMATQAHFSWSWFAGGVVLARARNQLPGIKYSPPSVHIESGGHGIRGGFSESGDYKTYDSYTTLSMFAPTGLWTRRKELFTQDEHGRWGRGGATAPWSWTDRIGYPGLVATDPVSFIIEQGVQGFSPLSRTYTLNQFWGIGGDK